VIALLLLWQLESSVGVYPLPAVVGMSGESRTYHGVTISGLKETQWTHVSVCGKVALAKHEADGDVHLRLEANGAFIVAEIVPYHPLPIPKVGQFVRVAGISREDKTHSWYEVHPVEAISVVGSCATSPAG
jgi:hypothetical protein